ncbi:HAD superfamily hydrolase Cof [Candidatus Mycoplasma haematolamae str. Purdue]|uniref:HAD superfamily hydrolase Cof n=1 Tax=Mycoplasma haematolamae (strain Purdue) TaxID=1212765 RepID=I7CIF9_MYCHA|nr:HAD family hydrolase [Candidatus Mycoplasma haematolamae]AFO51639.1 HAD superfamily hydrolase Cof [Candidatus Mycoplasma haematolamae str. Purdue]
MSNYEYIVITDLDGTLCTSTGKPSKESIEYLREFQKKRPNVLVTFSTGRPWSESKEIYEQLGLKSYISCLNGSYIYNPHNDHLILSSLSEKFLEYALFSPFFLSKVVTGALLTSKPNIPLSATDSPKALLDCFASSASSLIGIKLLYKSEDDVYVREIIENIKKFKPAPVVNIFYYPGLINLEIQSAQRDKFSFVEFAANHYGVDYPNILTFGDNHNDIPMMKGGVRGCALSNALFLLLQEATVLSKFSNDQDGVIKELDRYFGPL